MKKRIYNLLRYIAIFGNILYLLWFIYNAIDDGLINGLYCIARLNVQCVAESGFLVLVILNIFLLTRKN